MPILVLLACVAFLVPQSASCVQVPTEVDSLISVSGDLGDYPQASILILWDRRVVQVDSAGAATILVDQCLKLLADRAKDEQGDRSIRFDETRDTVIIETALTRQADGTWIEPEPDAFTITSAPEVQWASAYSQLKQRNVSFPGLSAGAVIYWKYRIEPRSGRSPWPDDFIGGVIGFGGFEPVQEQTFEIVSDTTLQFSYEMQNSTRKPNVNIASSRRSLKWDFRDLEQLTPEPNMVSSAHLIPRLVYTSFPDWSACGLYVGERFWRAVEEGNLAIREFAQVASVPGQASGPIAQNIAFWVQQNIRTVPLSLGAVGYEPNAADDVWRNRYGDVRDKLVLLSALLGSYGISSYPVLLQSSSTPFSMLPALDQFSHVILAVPLGEDTLMLDPTPRFSAADEIPYFRTLGTACQLVLGAPLLGPAADLVQVTRRAHTRMVVRLDSLGTLSGTAECEAVGDYAASARRVFSDQKEQERSIYFQSAVSRIGQGATVRDAEVSDPEQLTQPMRVSLGFECREYAVRQDDLILVELPVTPFSFAVSGFYPSMPEVKYPVDLPLQGTTETTTVMAIPGGYDVAYLPTPLLVENSYVSLSLVPKRIEDRVEWTQSLYYKQDLVPVADYPELRKAFEELVDTKNRLLVLEKKPK